MRLLIRVPLPAVAVLAAVVYLLLAVALPALISTSVPEAVAYATLGTLLASELLVAGLFPLLDARFRRLRLELTTDLRLLSSEDFEELVAQMFRNEGWTAHVVGGRGAPDGGVDLRLERDGEVRLVQCKRWATRMVGVEIVRGLGGVLASEDLPKGAGILVTTSEFTRPAVETADKLGVELIDRKALVPRLEAAGATNLLKPVTASQTPWPCPVCGSPMVLDHSPFGWWLHCPSYRSGCEGKRDLGTDPQRALETLQRGV